VNGADAWAVADPTPCPVCNRESCEDHLIEVPVTMSGLTAESHWKRLDLAELHNWKCEPLRPIVDGLIAHGNLVYVAAESQTGKTLLNLYIARQLLQGRELFGKFKITPIKRLLYLVLEDPDRRIRDRLCDTNHEFPEPIEPGRCIFYIAPGFTITDDSAKWQWLENLIQTDGHEVVFLDTYQKATPGINSFDDEKQSKILHKLSDLTRRLKITLIVIDHVRKQANGGRGRRELAFDDIKGTGGKAQNADCVILMDRTADRKHIRFMVRSKDFDQEVRIQLAVAPRGSTSPKFTYTADLEQLGANSRERGEKTRTQVLGAMPLGEWVSAPQIARILHVGKSTAQNHVKRLAETGQIEDNGVEGKYRRYRRIANIESGDKFSD
jgi:hypothetical protein